MIRLEMGPRQPRERFSCWQIANALSEGLSGLLRGLLRIAYESRVPDCHRSLPVPGSDRVPIGCTAFPAVLHLLCRLQADRGTPEWPGLSPSDVKLAHRMEEGRGCTHPDAVMAGLGGGWPRHDLQLNQREFVLLSFRQILSGMKQTIAKGFRNYSALKIRVLIAPAFFMSAGRNVPHAGCAEK